MCTRYKQHRIRKDYKLSRLRRSHRGGMWRTNRLLVKQKEEREGVGGMKHLGVLRVRRAVCYCWSLGWEEWSSRKEMRQKRWSSWNAMSLVCQARKIGPWGQECVCLVHCWHPEHSAWCTSRSSIHVYWTIKWDRIGEKNQRTRSFRHQGQGQGALRRGIPVDAVKAGVLTPQHRHLCEYKRHYFVKCKHIKHSTTFITCFSVPQFLLYPDPQQMKVCSQLASFHHQMVQVWRQAWAGGWNWRGGGEWGVESLHWKGAPSPFWLLFCHLVHDLGTAVNIMDALVLLSHCFYLYCHGRWPLGDNAF